MINIGIIGTSDISHSYIKILKKRKDCKIKFIFSRNKQRGLFFADKYNAKYIDNYEEILLNKNISTFFILNEPNKHIDFAHKAVNFNKNVFIEKPFDIDENKIEDFMKLIKKKKSLVQLNLQYQFSNEIINLKRIIDSKKYGRIINAYVELYKIKNRDYYTKGTGWRTKYGGVILNQGIHWLHNSIWLFGEPLKYFSDKVSHNEFTRINTTENIFIKFRNNISFFIFCSNDIKKENQEILNIRFEKKNLRFNIRKKNSRLIYRLIAKLFYQYQSPLEKQINNYIINIKESRIDYSSLEIGYKSIKMLNSLNYLNNINQL